jgi:hypothetical protein
MGTDERHFREPVVLTPEMPSAPVKIIGTLEARGHRTMAYERHLHSKGLRGPSVRQAPPSPWDSCTERGDAGRAGSWGEKWCRLGRGGRAGKVGNVRKVGTARDVRRLTRWSRARIATSGGSARAQTRTWMPGKPSAEVRTRNGISKESLNKGE